MCGSYSWHFLVFILVWPVGSTQFKKEKQHTDPDTVELTKDSSKHIKNFIKDELDADNDGLVSKNEMINKIEKSLKQQIENEIEELMNEHDLNRDNKISWKEFLSSSYPSQMSRNSQDQSYDKQKFKMADADKDGYLNLKEFGSFYFPEAENDNLIKWVMVDWLNKVDLNHDGFVTMNEFLASQTNGNPDIRAQKKLRQHFNEDYDINRDGKIDKNELREWLLPNRASAMRETGRILKSADDNGDGKLSEKEIIENNDSVLPLLQNTMYQDKDEL